MSLYWRHCLPHKQTYSLLLQIVRPSFHGACGKRSRIVAPPSNWPCHCPSCTSTTPTSLPNPAWPFSSAPKTWGACSASTRMTVAGMTLDTGEREAHFVYKNFPLRIKPVLQKHHSHLSLFSCSPLFSILNHLTKEYNSNSTKHKPTIPTGPQP